MTNDDRPFVSALMARVSDGIGAVVRGPIRLAGRVPMLVLTGSVMLAIVVVFVIRGAVQSPSARGVVSGLIAGLLVALVFGGAAAWTLMWAFAEEAPIPEHPRAAALEDALRPMLRELDAVRADVVTRAKRRSLVCVPLGIGAAGAAWGLMQLSAEPPDIFALLVFMVVGAVAAEAWAISSLDQQYRRRYQDRVLPLLAARFGDLTYRRASAQHRLEALERARVFHDYEHVDADDEIVGTYRGVSISVVSLRLTSGSGDDTRTQFEGLLVDLVLPRPVTGTTAIVTGEGMLFNLKARAHLGSLQLVPVEDARFASHYRVYATDPAAARALLTPDFTARFVALAVGSQFTSPGCLAEGDRFTMALARPGAPRLFEPPPYWTNAGGPTLAALHDDIATALGLADGVIDMAAQRTL